MIPKKTRFSRILAPIVGIALASTCAHAAIIITPTGAISSTEHDSGRTITNAIDGVGLSGGGNSSDILSETHDGGGSNTHWLSVDYSLGTTISQSEEILTFNLGGTFELDTIYLWAYNRAERNRGIRTFDIAFSTDNGATFSTPVSAASLNMSNFTVGTGTSTERSEVQTRTFDLQSDVTNVQFTNIQNFSHSRLALAEIRFGAIPEPSTALLGGLGMLCLLRRRR